MLACMRDQAGTSANPFFPLMCPVGFLILSYNTPSQLLRLARCLTEAFDAPPIVCNHNFDQCQFDTSGFPGNFTFVRPHVWTGWGSITCVNATLNALRILYEKRAPEWFFLLSGSDYPITPLREAVQKLKTGGFDAYMDHRPLRRGYIPPDHTDNFGFKSRRYVEFAYSRYHPMFVPIPWPFSPEKKRRLKFDFPVVDRLNPVLRRGMELYAGTHWFIANQRCADRLLADAPRVELLRHYYGNRHVPEEAFYHTFLCNYGDIAVSTESLRYEDWSANNWHPGWLGDEHIPALRSSGALIARKFHENAAVLDRVECDLLGLPKPISAASLSCK
jgi:hypothetical protein